MSDKVETMTIKVDATDAMKSVAGMSELVQAATTFCDLVDQGQIRSTRNYRRFKDALNKISEGIDTTPTRVIDLMHESYKQIHATYIEAFGPLDPNLMGNDVDHHINELIKQAALTDREQGIAQAGEMSENMRKFGTIDKPAAFYHLDGTPAKFDIDEDLGQLLLACERALDFINNGPLFGMPQAAVDELYDVRVVQLIPKLKAVIENRISVLYPYSKLVDMSFVERNDLLNSDPSRTTSIYRLRCTTQRMEEEAERLAAIVGEYREGLGASLPADEIMAQMATLTEHMQQIMNLFNWTIDDVKLFSRAKIGKLIPDLPDPVK